MNSTIFSNQRVCCESWWCKPELKSREDWNAELAKQSERMLLSNPPISTAKDGPTSIIESRRQRIPSTL